MDSQNNKALNSGYDFNGYLLCEISKDTIQVNLKVKTSWGKYTLNKTRYCRTERYSPWDRRDRKTHISHRRRRTDRKLLNNVNTIEINTDTSFEKDILIRDSLGYAPEVFVNRNFTATVPSTDSEQNQMDIEIQHNFIGTYCDKCANAKPVRCWCNGLDWDDQVIVVDPPNHPTLHLPRAQLTSISLDRNLGLNNSNDTAYTNKLTVYPVRKPPAGWAKFRQDFLREPAKAKETMDTNKRTNENGNGIIMASP